MSATLAALLNELQPDWSIQIFEALDKPAEESSSAWNNAGTGHAGLCELNYTPQSSDGTVDVAKAIRVHEAFEVSKQLWAYFVENKSAFAAPEAFIHHIPHHSFVRGDANVDFLRTRFETLSRHHFFEEMEFSEDRSTLADWLPLMMEGRASREKVASTRMELGTDVNFGELAAGLISYLQKHQGVQLHLGHEVSDLKQQQDGTWRLAVKNKATGEKQFANAKFVFLGAGGGSLHLLQKSGIPEGKGYAGFPVGGQWLVCSNPELVEAHHAKVYGKPALGAPPMSVPHLDTRFIRGEKALLFGPYAGFSTRFLRNGSLLDMPRSFQPDNLIPLMAVGLHNLALLKYLITQLMQSPDDRINTLRNFIPSARKEDWRLEVAGQRVQVIKKHPEQHGVLKFGTEVITSADGSLAALLGASPGASTAVTIMINALERCFPQELNSPAWQSKLKKMIPSYGQSLASDAALTRRVSSWTADTLQLHDAMAHQ